MIHIDYEFTFLNEYIAAERSHRQKAAKIKRDTTFAIKLMLLGKPSIKTPCRLHYHWRVKNKRRDLDNIGHAAKYINDGMVKAGIIPDDNLNHIIEIKHTFEVNKKVGVDIESY
jgi:Holliday junction resolvase RusA-like endonuclease